MFAGLISEVRQVIADASLKVESGEEPQSSVLTESGTVVSYVQLSHLDALEMKMRGAKSFVHVLAQSELPESLSSMRSSKVWVESVGFPQHPALDCGKPLREIR